MLRWRGTVAPRLLNIKDTTFSCSWKKKLMWVHSINIIVFPQLFAWAVIPIHKWYNRIYKRDLRQMWNLQGLPNLEASDQMKVAKCQLPHATLFSGIKTYALLPHFTHLIWFWKKKEMVNKKWRKEVDWSVSPPLYVISSIINPSKAVVVDRWSRLIHAVKSGSSRNQIFHPLTPW